MPFQGKECALPWLSRGLGPAPGEREEPQDASTGVQSQQGEVVGVAVGRVGPGGTLSWGGEEEGQCRLLQTEGEVCGFPLGWRRGEDDLGITLQGNVLQVFQVPCSPAP